MLRALSCLVLSIPIACGSGQQGQQDGQGGSAGSAGNGASGAGADSSSGGSAGAPAPPEREPAAGVRLSAVRLYQGVEVPLMEDGVATSIPQRVAPVVAQRPALVRVFIDLDASFRARELVVSFELDGTPEPFSVEEARFVRSPSTDASFSSTFNFDIPAEFITESTGYRVRVLEPEPGVTSPGDASAAEFPPGDGTSPLGGATSGPLRVRLVPVVNNGLVPDTSPERVQEYEDFLYKLYPVDSIEIDVRAVADPESVDIGPVSAEGSNWIRTLNFVENLRSEDGADSRVYYFGAITPTNSFGEYCGLGCVAGLGSVPPPDSNAGRASIGLGFFQNGSGESSPSTMAHELGHSLGRLHSPCMTNEGVDPNYLYPDGRVGVLGFDLLESQPISDRSFDIMGYCNPTWVSDYTYGGLYERIAFVNAFGQSIAVKKRLYRVAVVDFDGSLSWGLPVETAAPRGQIKTIETLDATGATIGTVSGTFVPVDHLEGGMLYVEDATVARLSLSPSVTDLRPVDVGTTAVLSLNPR